MIIRLTNSGLCFRQVSSGGNAGKLMIAFFTLEIRFSPGVSVFYNFTGRAFWIMRSMVHAMHECKKSS